MIQVITFKVTSLLFLLILFLESSISQKNEMLSLSEQLAYSTVKIRVMRDNSYSTGTGFFFDFLIDDKYIPVIITNKHLIKGAKKGEFFLTGTNADGSPSPSSRFYKEIDNFETFWILHPDSNIDLAVMPIAPILNEAVIKNFKPFFRTIDKSFIPTEDQLKQLTAVEDILIVGYPRGIWDTVNNYPIFRKGITATHPANRYNGRDEFLIDAAIYPGSSGSPVFLYNIGNYVSKDGTTIIGNRFYFLGVIYAVYIYNPKGELKIITIPDRTDTLSFVRLPINLGLVISSSKILDFEPLLKKLIDLLK